MLHSDYKHTHTHTHHISDLKLAGELTMAWLAMFEKLSRGGRRATF